MCIGDVEAIVAAFQVFKPYDARRIDNVNAPIRVVLGAKIEGKWRIVLRGPGPTFWIVANTWPFSAPENVSCKTSMVMSLCASPREKIRQHSKRVYKNGDFILKIKFRFYDKN